MLVANIKSTVKAMPDQKRNNEPGFRLMVELKEIEEPSLGFFCWFCCKSVSTASNGFNVYVVRCWNKSFS